jgi:hypothetical protein
MSELYFSVVTPEQAIYDSRLKLAAGQTTVYNGYLAGMTGGELIVSTGSPIGMFYDFMAMEDVPTSQNLGAYLPGKYTNYVTGAFQALVGKDLFSSGAIAANGAKLYDNGAGKLGAASVGSSVAIGQVMDADAGIVQNKAGAQTVALVRFDFTQLI